MADELLFEMVPAISCGSEVAPVIIPTVMDGPVHCMPVTVRAGWLTQLVEQKRRTRDSKAVVFGVLRPGGSCLEGIGAS